MNYPNVAILVPAFPNVVQTYVINQLAAFKEIGINFSIIANKKNTYNKLPLLISKHKLLDEAIYINTEPTSIPLALLTLPISSPRYRYNLKKILSFKNWQQYGNAYLYKTIIRSRALAFRDFDIIHSHSMFSSFHYLFMKDALSIPLITTYHGQVPKGVKKLDDRKLSMVFDKGDAFLVNTNFARDELIKLGCVPEKIHIIPQGTNLDLFPFFKRGINQKEKIIILTVGRLSIEKGHHTAIKAAALLADQFPDLEYHIVGEGPARKELEKFCTQLNIRDKVVFHGFKTGDDLHNIFTNAHIFVLPSIDTKDGYLVETQGVVLQEAQASGIPVIGSKTGGIPEVIRSGVTGIIFNERDHIELSEIIRKLIIDPVFYEKISLAGRHDVEENYDINIICQRIITLYMQTLRTR